MPKQFSNLQQPGYNAYRHGGCSPGLYHHNLQGRPAAACQNSDQYRDWHWGTMYLGTQDYGRYVAGEGMEESRWHVSFAYLTIESDVGLTFV